MSGGLDARLTVVVGSGGVGKTTLAAALGASAARAGHQALVMTFDPSHRLKDALGVGEEARERPVEVPLGDEAGGRLWASLLDARLTFDRLVERYAPDAAARDRILGNRYYDQLSGGLAGILEYMAAERLFEVAAEGRFSRIVLDTPPTRQALDFLAAPDRIVSFLDSGVLKLVLRPWFDARGRLRPTSRWGLLGRRVERYLDEIVGLDLLRDMAEFFQAFAPLYAGFRQRASEVKALLRRADTLFLLVASPHEERLPDTAFFARRLAEGGFRLGPLVVNQVHPRLPPLPEGLSAAEARAARLLAWLAERDARGVAGLAALLSAGQRLVAIPLLPSEPTDLPALLGLGREIEACLGEPSEASCRSAS
jgi:anion-transporting  ArsA/GET3 family ATPase